MEWTDEGIVLGVRRHGESSAIVELLTRGHGRHLGLVRGGAGRGCGRCCSPATACARLAGAARRASRLLCDRGTRLRAATVLASSHAVYGVTHLAALARLLPERDPHEDIYEMLEHTLDDFDDAGGAAVHLIRFELAMLAELGFGLDLEIALRPARPPIWSMSRRIGRRGVARGRRALARPAAAAAAFPASGEDGANGWSDQDLQDGFQLTGMFLLRHVLEPRGQGHSDAREGFINAVARHRAGAVVSSIVSASGIGAVEALSRIRRVRFCVRRDGRWPR